MLRRFLLTPLVLLIGLAIGWSAAPARAADDPAGFISDLGARTIGVLTARLPEGDREAQFRTLLDAGFDLPAISRFVLGPYWKSATDAQRAEFSTLFRDYIVHIYAVRFSSYSGQAFTVMDSRPEGSDGALVHSQIVATNGPPTKVDWQVKKTGSGYRINDVSVESISMTLTQRQEFASVIQRGGGQLEALLKMLREKAVQRAG